MPNVGDKLEQVVSINLGFRPGIDFSGSGGPVGEATVFQQKSDNDYQTWYAHGDIPGDMGYVWNKFPIGDKAPLGPLGPGKDAQDRVKLNWENYYYYLREAIGAGDVSFPRQPHHQLMQVEPGEESENLERFLNSEDEAMVEMGKAMQRGYDKSGRTLIEPWMRHSRIKKGVSSPLAAGMPGTGPGGARAEAYRKELYLAGRPASAVGGPNTAAGKLRQQAGIGTSNTRGIQIEGIAGGHWLQYPTNVATTAWMKDGPQMTFDTMRRTGIGPIQSILNYFLERILETANKEDEGALEGLKVPEGGYPVSQEDIQDVGGSSYEEKLFEVLGLGYVPEDLKASGAGHRIDLIFRKNMSASSFGGEEGGLKFKKADITSSYFDSADHHGVGRGMGSGKRKRYLVREGIINQEFMETHWNGRIETYNKILEIVFAHVGGVTTESKYRTASAQKRQKHKITRETGTMKNIRRLLVEAAKGVPKKEGGTKLQIELSEIKNNLKRVSHLLLNSEHSQAIGESGEALLQTVEWVLHHLGDALINSTYANIMPIRMDSYDGTLIVIFAVDKRGFYKPIGPGGSQISVIDHGVPMSLLHAAGYANDREMQKLMLQTAQRAFAMTGFRSIRGGAAIMNQLNIGTKKRYTVSWMLPVDDDIKTTLLAYFGALTGKIIPGATSMSNNDKKGLQKEIKNEIKKKANAYSTNLRTFMTGRLHYGTQAAVRWLSYDVGRLPGALAVRNLWAMPYFTASAAPGQKGGAIQASGQFVSRYKSMQPEWVTWAQPGETKRLRIR